MEAKRFDSVIIGGGAAGLAAAVTALKRKFHGKLLLIEANETCGKKLLATGGGRCNISNLAADEYQGTKKFFEEIGVLLRVEEGGRVYPMSGQAASVRDALVAAVTRKACENFKIQTGVRVERIEKSSEPGGEFSLACSDGQEIIAGKVLIAAGGKAGPQYGCLGDGYAFARSLGHTVESIRPALVPLVYAEGDRQKLSALKGVRIRSRAELFVEDKYVAASSGELQFTDFGLSGIMIFDLSTMMPKSILEGKPRTEVVIDFVPGEEETTLERIIRENEGFGLEGVVGKKLSDHLAKEGSGDAAEIAALAKRFIVTVSGTKGWKEAQTTLGGVRLSDINEETGESLRCKGIFFAGEILEPVYICGGYNLNHAWLTGMRAGRQL